MAFFMKKDSFLQDLCLRACVYEKKSVTLSANYNQR